MKLTLLSSLLALAALATASTQDAFAADEIVSIRARFADVNQAETPDFQKHVVPLMGRLGCNGRACHGSFQGQGGLQFSLFGYDFEMDHKGWIDRIDLDNPAESYALEKPTLVEPHEGGKRMDVGSWEYRIFLNWIQAGAKDAKEPIKLERLEVTPREVVFSGPNQTKQLKAVAVWADGTREDVTPLCRFTSNDDVICGIDEDGMITSGDVGDSNVVVAYDMAVVPVAVLRPLTDQIGERYPAVATATKIDELVVEKLSKMGIVPSDVCSDAEFLRRVTLDITATLPTVAEVREFLADNSPDKRSRKIDELLSTPAYAAWWTVQMCDWTGCSDQQLNNVNPVALQQGSKDWYDWLYKRIDENVPYDDIMENIVVAESRRPDESYREYCERMTAYSRDKNLSFADQKGLIYFWGRQNFRQTEDRAIGFAYTFMGTRIQCAQCHKHPFDVWTQKDFQQFERFFARVNFARNGSDRQEYNEILKELDIEGLRGNEQRRAIQAAVKKGKTVPFPEIAITGSPNSRRRKDDSKPQDMARLLGEQEVDLASIEDPRTALMDWLRNSPTKLMAKAFVNRVWANYFNKGIVEPTDDLSLANPPSNPALLDYLVDGLIAHDYDMKWLHREICLSDTYQRSWRPNETNVKDERNFSHAIPRRLPAETAYDALVMATAADNVAGGYLTELDERATTKTSPPRNSSRGTDYALSVFGRSIRESNCDCDRSSEVSLLQTLFVRNDVDTLNLLERKDGWLTSLNQSIASEAAADSDLERKLEAGKIRLERLEVQLAKAKKSGNKKQIETLTEQRDELQAKIEKYTPESKTVEFDAAKVIEDAYLRTLSRFPNDQERELAANYLSEAKTPADGLRDLMWALINTKEFIVNH